MKTKKIISMLLIATMLLSVFSVVSFASSEENSSNIEEDSVIINEIQIGASEESGHNCSEQLEILNSDDFYVTSTSDEIIDSILSRDTFKISGTIQNENSIISINDYFDFSENNKYQIAKWARDNNLISDADLIECYCDLIINRNFDNIHCLTDVVFAIQKYEEDGNASESLLTKMEIALGHGDEDFTSNSNSRSANIIPEYESENFIVDCYGSLNAAQNPVVLANYLEQIRTAYINMGFLAPYVTNDYPKIEVKFYDTPGEDSNGSAVAGTASRVHYSQTNPKVSSALISIYDYVELDDYTKYVIAHEYFHAIQYAYNGERYWSKEGFANWGSLNIVPATLELAGSANAFLKRQFSKYIVDDYIGDINQYDLFMLPLAMQQLYGIDSVVALMEEIASSDLELDYYGIVDVYNEVISDFSATSDFDTILRYLYTTSIDKDYWYSQFFGHLDLNWSDIDQTYKTTSTMNSYTSYTYGTLNTSNINDNGSHYYEVTTRNNFVGSFAIEVDYEFTEMNGSAVAGIQFYGINRDGTYTNIIQNTAAIDSNTYVVTNVENYSKFYLVLTVIGNDEVSFGGDLKIYSRNTPVNYGVDERYYESRGYLAKGEYAEYKVTFEEPGDKIFQTFGTKDTKMEIYKNGTLQVSDDDGGCGTNAFLKYWVSSNVEYTVKIYFYATYLSGEFKFAVTQSDGVKSDSASYLGDFDDFLTIRSATNYTFTAKLYSCTSKAFVFIPPSSGNYCFELSSGTDTYIYVIDTTYTDTITGGINYNDDGGVDYDAKLTTSLISGRSYFVIFAPYDYESIPSSYVNVTVTVTKK